MVLRLNDFITDLLDRNPGIGLVTWDKLAALNALRFQLCKLFAKRRKLTYSELSASRLRRAGFEQKLRAALISKNCHKTFLLIHRIEPLGQAAGQILNGYRELLGSLAGLVV